MNFRKPKLSNFYQKMTFKTYLLLFCLISTIKYGQKQQSKSNKKTPSFILTLDAGHGFQDSGAVGWGNKEKDITLSIVNQLGKKIEENQKDVKVIYTRTDDSYPELYRRAEIANTNRSHLFISVHCNSTKAISGTAHGTETWILGAQNDKKKHDNFDIVSKENSVIFLEKDYKQNYDGYNPNSPESVIGMTLMQDKFLENSLRFAQIMEETFHKNEGRFSRGVKQGPFLVLVKTAMPAVLIETGFINNKEESVYLASEEGQQKIVNSIYETFVKYKHEYYKKSGIFPEIPSKEEEKIQEPEIKKEEIKDIYYKLLFFSSEINYQNNDQIFKNIKDIEKIKTKNRYQYFAEISSDKKKLQEKIKEYEKIGFVDSKIIEFNLNKELYKATYHIQLMYIDKRFRKSSKELKGLKDIERRKNGSMFEYIYGSYKTIGEAYQKLNEVKNLGFNDAILIIE